MIDDIKLPPEFISMNDVPVSVAWIKRERMEEILRDAIKADRQQRGEPRAPELASKIINDACWKFVETMPHAIPGPIFNELKPALYAAICHVLARYGESHIAQPSVPEHPNNENDLLVVLGVLSDCHLAIEDDFMGMGFDELLSRIIKSMNSIRAMLEAAPKFGEEE